MAIFNSITFNNFRNLNSAAIEFSPQYNLFYGDNGSGKTSLLESIYFLGLGKSFRAANSAKLIRHGAESFNLFAKLQNNSTLGIARTTTGERKIKLDGDLQNSIAAVTRLLPIQFMSPMSYRFFHDGPKVRRQHLDWALFHVEHSFHQNWQVLQRTLKQRNSALKQNLSTNAWDEAFVESAEKLDKQRQLIFTLIESICERQLAVLLPDFKFKLRYQRGWPKDKCLSDLIQENKHKDIQLGYTYYGPQRADFLLLTQSLPVQDVLSQGQQKLAAYALHLSLGSLLHQQTNSSPIYLIDDLPSELDNNSRQKITESLQLLNAQTFITGISNKDLESVAKLEKTSMFHVEHGTVTCITPRRYAYV